MLTIFQLQHLPLEQQASYVWEHGEYSYKKVKLMYTVALYWMGSFWAEVVYNNMSNEVEEILFREAFHNNKSSMKAIRERLVDFMCMVHGTDNDHFSAKDIILFYTFFSFLLIMVAVAAIRY